MKGQSAIEYSSILAIMLIALIPIVYISLSTVEDSQRSAQASSAIVALVDATDIVLAQGPGSSTTVDIHLPRAVNPEKTGLINREIRICVYMSNGAESDFFALAKASLTGTLPTSQGRHRLKVEMLHTGIIEISEPN